jgi:hypothetical protein
MEELVKDAILTNTFNDLVLIRLVELTIDADRSGRPLFPDLLTEPAFFRKNFRLWVSEALEEKKALDAAQERNPFEEE